MSTIDKLLEDIRKLLEQKGNTKDTLSSWQELMDRRETTTPGSIMAADAMKGFVGSWAASYSFHPSISPTTEAVPVPTTGHTSRLGLRGMPEINFAPYNANTNNFGIKSPSLIGHPVSFEVYGPTLKVSATVQEWTVSGNGYTLEMVQPAAGTQVQSEAVDDLYTQVPATNFQNSPLFLLVSDGGLNESGSTSTSDESHWSEKVEGVSRYEIFRVNQITTTSIVLADGKPITDYWDPSGDPLTSRLRSITLIRPKAAALVPIHGNGASRKTWAVLPPVRAHQSDYWPSRTTWVNTLGGITEDWGGHVTTPIPKPIAKGQTRLDDDNLALLGIATLPYGRFRIQYQPGITTEHILHIYDVSGADEVPDPHRLFGYFEVAVVDENNGYIDLKRREEVHPSTGVVDYGSDLRSASVACTLSYTVHRKILSIFALDYPHDEIESARLTNLIDPTMVARSAKHTNSSLVSGARADKAVFDTRTGANPGSLLDLGFRMVLFPSDGLGNPDWENPLNSRELILDPSLDEKQYVEIDYAAGLVKFSHEPVVGSDVFPHHFQLFACFVPYTMEGGQTGSAVRVTGGNVLSPTMGNQTPSQYDVLSNRVHMYLRGASVLSQGDTLVVSIEGASSLPQQGMVSIASAGLNGNIEEEMAGLPDLYYSEARDLNNGLFELGNVYVAGGTLDFSTIWDQVALVLRRREDIAYAHDVTYGSSVRTDVVRHAFADLTYGLDGSVTVLNTLTAGPAEELRAYYPFGTSSEKARFHLHPETMKWTVDDPPWFSTSATPSPNKTHDIGLEITRGRLFSGWTWGMPAGETTILRVLSQANAISMVQDNTPRDKFFLRLASETEVGTDNLTQELMENPQRFHAVIEGAKVTSNENVVNVPENTRFVVAMQRYSPAFSTNVAEAPMNPIYWYTQEYSTSGSLTDLVNTLNASSGLSAAYIDTSNDSLKVVARNVRFLPSKNRLTSQAYNFPINTSQTFRMICTVRSADRRYPTRWTTFEWAVNTAKGAVSLGDADALADFLNQGQSTSEADALLNKAGFYRDIITGTTPVQYDERQFKFIGPSDPRFTGLSNDQVQFICTGTGAGDAASVANFFNVEIELRPTSKIGNGDNLLTFLGNEFIVSNTVEQPLAIGLFWGTSGQTVIPAPTASELASWQSQSSGTEFLGFSPYGSKSISGWLGSHKIIDRSIVANAGDPYTILQLQKPKGDSWHYSEQASSSGFLEPGFVVDESAPPDTHFAQQNLNLSRWADPGYPIDTVDPSNITAGFEQIFVSYSHHNYPAARFSCDLLSTNIFGYPSWMIKVSPIDKVNLWGDAEINYDDISVGDLVRFMQQDISAEGRIIAKSDGYFYCMVSPTGKYMGFDSYSLEDNFLQPYANPESFGGNLSVDPMQGGLLFSPKADISFSVVPSTSGSSGLIRNHIEALYTPVLQASSEMALMNSGYAKTGTSMISGGRMSLFSAIGWNEPTGISLHTLSRSEVGGLPSKRGSDFTSYIESGVFTTSVVKPGHGLDTNGIFQREGKGQRGSFMQEASSFGGVGGVRISGDAHVWIRNFRALRSTSKRAYVRQVAVTNTYQEMLNPSSIFGANRLGGVTSAQLDAGSAHAPSGVSALGHQVSYSLQEATISIELSLADMRAFSLNEAQHYLWPSTAHPAHQASDTTADRVANRMYNMSQQVTHNNLPNMVSSLEGSYIKTEASSIPNINAGIWRICGAPIVVPRADKEGIPLDFSFDETQQHFGSESIARMPASTVVATIQLRVERYAEVPADTLLSAQGGNYFSPMVRTADINPNAPDGLTWQIFRDAECQNPIYFAEVVDPGGSPTGAPRSLRGLTLNPKAATGREALLCDILPVATEDSAWQTIYNEDFIFAEGNTSASETNARNANGLLLGIHDQMDRKGRSYSTAFLAIRDPGSFFAQKQLEYARLVVYAQEDDTELVTPGDFGEFIIDGDGRLKWMGQPRRLGPGVLFDGGLGLVQATAFRSTPQPRDRDTIGALSVLGRGGYPLHDYLNPQTNKGVELPSTFNTVEFHGDTTIVSPTARLNFEDAWAGEGLVANWNINMFLQNHSFSYAQRAAIRSGIVASLNASSIFAPDTLFPQMTGGIHFKTPGTVVYERPIRALDATGVNPYAMAWSGSPRKVGIVGLEIPQIGEALLLPKGPPTLQGQGQARANGNAVGVTPLDRPLYEFTNAVTPNYKISSFNICPNNAIGSSSQPAPDVTAGVSPHVGFMGAVHQGYRHSRSREDAKFYGRAAQHQIRIMDGMVIEDISSGQFYTAGDVGRWLSLPGNNAVFRPGEQNRPAVVGSVTTYGGTNDAEPEIIYDLSPFYDPSRSDDDLINGYGDRLTNGLPGRPLSGHQFRVVPNVEFVPVMGKRGVDGGLVPPFTILKGMETPYVGADAFFYSNAYNFKASGALHGTGDIGRMLYICGTYEYKYTGWWVIIDVIENHTVHTNPELVRDVAVLRKWQRNHVDGDIPGDAMTNDGAFPMGTRSPILQSAGAYRLPLHNTVSLGHTNFPRPPGDMFLAVTDQNGVRHSRTILQTEFAAAALSTVVDLITFLNNDVRSNGQAIASDFFGGVATDYTPWILWTQPDASGALRCQYLLQSMPNKDQLLGGSSTLQVAFLTRNDTPYGTLHFGHPASVGFYSFIGGNQVVDRTLGDRNNYWPIEAYHTVTTNLVPSPTTANGLRWVFSHPLGEENVGSYLHLRRPRIYRFGSPLQSQTAGGVSNGTYSPMTDALVNKTWTSGHQRKGDYAMTPDVSVEIFRINRCPTTSHILLGGDCETFHPEFTAAKDATVSDKGLGRPIMYSPLSTYGFWPREDGQILEDVTGPLQYPLTYALQPIARERIVTISPSSATSSSNLIRGQSDGFATPIGPQGVGIGVLGTESYTEASFVQTPWVLLDRNWAQRKHVSKAMVSSNVALNNANSNDPDSNTAAITSEYTWAPAGEWWQMFTPRPELASGFDLLPDASDPPPTLRIDLTEAFTQSMSPGSGLNSPHQGRTPKGARLNRIWVNFGVWGNELGTNFPAIPGYARLPGGAGPQPENDVLKQMHMCFNLIVELPGSQQRQVNIVSDHPMQSGTEGFPFGGRAPTASRYYDQVQNQQVGGTIIVPLYVNREAGDMMPNVMERWVDVGPFPKMASSASLSSSQTDPHPDWLMGDYEYGFGCSTVPDGGGDHPTLFMDYQGDVSPMIGNSFNPVLWGGIDFENGADGGPFTNPENSLALHTPFARASRTGGGVRQRFTSGLHPDGYDFKKDQPISLHAAAMTGIVVAHSATHPSPIDAISGSLVLGSKEGPRTCPHAFTIALTPVGDDFVPTTENNNSPAPIEPVDSTSNINPIFDGYTLARYGRSLDTGKTPLNIYSPSEERPFKVGNWLDKILAQHGFPYESGSMLPPGARVYLEVTCGQGQLNGNWSGSGAWVGSVKCSFEVETADGTAWSNNVNRLGDEEG